MDQEAKRNTLRLFTNGLYILTARAGSRLGAATITWVSQASFNPPLLMAAVRTESNVFDCLKESRAAALHIVAVGQEKIAQKFFAPTKAGAGTINGQPYREGKTGAPLLNDFPAHVECRVLEVLEGRGDHATVLMEVVEANYAKNVRPLTVADSPWTYGG